MPPATPINMNAKHENINIIDVNIRFSI